VITSPQPRRMLEINVSRRPRLHQEVRRRGQELGTEKSPLVRGHKLCPGPEGPDLVCNLALQGSGSGALTTREGLANCRGEPREIGGALCVVCCQRVSKSSSSLVAFALEDHAKWVTIMPRQLGDLSLHTTGERACKVCTPQGRGPVCAT